MRLLSYKEESEHIAQKMGMYLPPHKLADISRQAAKILTLLTKDRVVMTLQECLITLDIVKNIIEEMGGQKNYDAER